MLLLPIAGFLLLALAGSRLEKMLGKRAVGALAVLPIAVAFGITSYLTQQLAGIDAAHRSIVMSGPSWIDIMGLRIPFELLVDPLSMTMSLIITGVGSLIFLYSTGYMGAEREYSRFFTYMNLFAAAMLLLVLGNNLLLLFVGWEGVGLCSYLLIGFWYKDLANAKAANKAFVVNRIGDWGLTLGLLLITALVAGTTRHVPDARYLSYDAILPELKIALERHPDMATLAAFLLFIGAAGKSAQFPLYLWLPDAMAGPTPVSALIHAATMVTSGVVLLNRMHVVFESAPLASTVICGIGAFTALFAALIAFGQTDIKKVLAYSTVSQLGFMFIGCGAGAYWAGIFHVTTHAFFKALLFLGAGAVIHAMSHNQDMRNYGNLKKYMPITFTTMVIGTLAISAIGIPGVFGFAGFYSKEALLGPALGDTNGDMGGVSALALSGQIGLFVAVLTAAYMMRLTWLTFFGKERWRTQPIVAEDHEEGAHEDAQPRLATLDSDPYGFFLSSEPKSVEEHDHALTSDHTPKEVSPSMWLPLVVLAVLSVGGGYVLENNGLLEKWLQPSSAPVTSFVPAEAPSWLPMVSAGAGLLGLVFGLIVANAEKFDLAKWSGLRLWARNQFGFDELMTNFAVQGGSELAVVLDEGVEVGLIDRIVNGSAGVAAWIGKVLSVAQRGLVRSYAVLMLLGGIAILSYMMLGGKH
ncbi:MAG TPA: NADH-quinone oxidoreductase subunit L [Fimbriimonas sp.]|nr:NADH-quinone oxidoreductase subunit L [Fimbriimonas sp.]